MIEIQLKNSLLKTKISECDIKIVSKFEWNLSSTGYVVLSTVKVEEPTFLHRIILETGLYASTVDHIDRDKLNNTRENLRIVSLTENLFNAKKQLKVTSKFKGVSWCKRDERWVAYTSLKDKSIHLLSSKIEEEAAFAYDCATRFLGVLAFVNGTEAYISEERRQYIKRKVEFGIEFTFPDYKQLVKQ